MADPIRVENLGEGGVDVDTNPLRSADNSTLLSQNATYDATRQRLGGLTKRPGYARFNTVSLGGPLLGGIAAPFAGTAQAVGSGGGGDAGDNGGTGDPLMGTGTAPGDNANTLNPVNSSSPSYTPAGAAQFNGGTGAIFGGARLIVLGRDDTTHGNTGGVGWFVTSYKLNDSANVTTTPGPPEGPYNYPPTTLFPVAKGSKPFAIYPPTGEIFYALSREQVSPAGISPAVQTIRKTNGAFDVVVCTTPTSDGPAPSAWLSSGTTGFCRCSITTMHVGADGFIYLGQKLKAAGQDITGNAGRILKLNPATNAISVINTTASPVTGSTANVYTTTIPMAIAHFQNCVFWGEFNLGGTSELLQDTVTTVSAVIPDQTYAVADIGMSQGEAVMWMYPFPQVAPASNPSMDVFSNRVLFAGLATNKATPALAYTMMRRRGAPPDSTKWFASLQGSGGATVNGNYFVSAVAFFDNLYVSFYNPTQTAKIYKFTPSYGVGHTDTDGFWNGDGVWSTVFTNAGSTDRVPYQLYVDKDVIYAIGTLGLGGQTHHMFSTDGTTWTDKTTNIPTSPNSTSPTVEILFGLNQ